MEHSVAVNLVVKYADDLESRWRDEKEYEDFADYQAAAKAFVESQGLGFVRLSAKPFMLTVIEANSEHRILVNSKGISVKTFAAVVQPSSTQSSKENSMTKPADLSTMSLADLTAVYNKYAAKPIKKFSCSKEAAIAKVQSVLPVKATATKKLGIGKRTVELLKDGLSPADVLATLRKEFKSDVSSMASVYWYSSKIKTGDIE